MHTSVYPGLVAGQTQANTDGGFVWVHHRVVMNTLVIADADWLIVRLVGAVEGVDWVWNKTPPIHTIRSQQ